MSKIVDAVVETIKLTERVDAMYIKMKDLSTDYKEDAKDLRDKFHLLDKRISIIEAVNEIKSKTPKKKTKKKKR